MLMIFKFASSHSCRVLQTSSDSRNYVHVVYFSFANSQMSYQTGYIYAIVNTIERVKIPQLQEAIQRLNEKTKLVKSNTEIVTQVAKLDTDVATIMKKLNLVDGEFKDEDLTLLQTLADKLEITTQTVNIISDDIVKIKNDYYHLINVEHLSTLTQDIKEVKEIAASLNNYASLANDVEKNKTAVRNANSEINVVKSYFNPISSEKYTDEPINKEDKKEGEGEQTGEEGIETQATTDDGTSGDNTTLTEEQKTENIQHNMQFIIRKILDLMNLDSRIDNVEGELNKIDASTIVTTANIGNTIGNMKFTVQELLATNDFSVELPKTASLTDWFKFIMTHISMQYKTVADESGVTTTKSLAEYVDELVAQLDVKYDDETKLSIDGVNEKTIKEHLIDLFTNKYDASSTVTVNNVPKTIEAHLNDLSTSKYDDTTKIATTADQTEGKTIKEHIETLYSEIGVSSGSGSNGNGGGNNLAAQIENLRQTKYGPSTELLINGSNSTIPEHFGSLYTNKYDENTTLTINGSAQKISTHLENLYTDKYDASTTFTINSESRSIETHLDNLARNKYDANTKLTVGANNDEQTIKTHLDNLTRNKYDENTPITITEGNVKTIKNHLSNLYTAKTDTEQNFEEINGAIGEWNDSTVGTTLGLEGVNNNITKALEAIVSTTNNINSSMSLFNGSVATQNKVLLGNSYPSYNRNLIGLVNGANYEIITETEATIIPEEDLNDGVIVNSIYLESIDDEILNKIISTVYNDKVKVSNTIRVRLGPNVKLSEFLYQSQEEDGIVRHELYTKIFDGRHSSQDDPENIIIQCYTSSLNGITADNIKALVKDICRPGDLQTQYNVTFVFYDYPPESSSVSDLVTSLNQTTETTKDNGEGVPGTVSFYAKLVYLF